MTSPLSTSTQSCSELSRFKYSRWVCNQSTINPSAAALSVSQDRFGSSFISMINSCDIFVTRLLDPNQECNTIITGTIRPKGREKRKKRGRKEEEGGARAREREPSQSAGRRWAATTPSCVESSQERDGRAGWRWSLSEASPRGWWPTLPPGWAGDCGPPWSLPTKISAAHQNRS